MKGPRDATIGLFVDTQSNFSGEPFYEFIIGGWGNKRCSMSKAGENGVRVSLGKTEENNAGYMSTAEFRSFWISWADNTISFGSGAAIGQSTILSYSNSTAKAEVIQLAFSTKFNMFDQFKYNNGLFNLLILILYSRKVYLYHHYQYDCKFLHEISY